VGRLVETDLAAWPLVVFRMPERLDLPAFESFMRGIDGALGRQAKFSAIIDTSALTTFPNAIERRWFIEEVNKRTFAEKAYNLGNAVVIVSTPARAVLTAMNWVRAPVVTQYLVPTFSDALDWCCMRLIQAGIGLTPTINALRADARVPASTR
jgi:hypothetical protein